MKKATLLILFLGILLMECSPSDVLPPKAYLSYLNDGGNGLVKKKAVGAFRFTLKYLPGDWIAYQQYQSKKTANIDSLKQHYKSGVRFLLTVAPNEEVVEGGFDVMTETVSSKEDFKIQTHALNFELKEHIQLKIADKTITPAIAMLENIYGLHQHRNINLVFPVEEVLENYQNYDWDVVFDDVIFQTGMHHFVFEQKDIKNIPELKID